MKKILIWRSEVEKTMRGFIKKFSYGQKGFTLIELLVVVAILGVLAAVVMPNVTKFMGSGKTEAGKTELANVQLAMTAMMADTGSSNVTAVATKTNVMTAFPGTVTTPVAPLVQADYKLFGGAYNYLQKSPTTYYYTVVADGTVKGFWVVAGGAANEIGLVAAP